MSGVTLGINLHGFTWGPITVRRELTYQGRVQLDITTATGQSIAVCSSATGRSLRVFKDGRELK